MQFDLVPGVHRAGVALLAVALCAVSVPRAPAGESDEPVDVPAVEARSAEEAFQTAFKSAEDEAAKKQAVVDLGYVRHPAVFRALGRVLASGEAVAVRRAAAKALGGYHDRRCTSVLVAGLEPSRKEEELHLALLGALGQTDDPAAVEPLAKIARAGATALDDKTFKPAGAAIDALAGIRHRSAVDALFKIGETVEASGKTTGAPDPAKMQARYGLMDRVLAALTKLTGQEIKEGDAFPTFKGYQKWWKENAKAWEAKKKTKSD